MSCNIAVSEDGRYIIMTVQGDMTRKHAIEWNIQAHSLGRQLGITRYLVDLRESRNSEPNAEGYRFVNNDIPRSAELDRSARVAVVVAPGDNSHNFIEVVARSAGLDVTIFNNPELARRHLLAP